MLSKPRAHRAQQAKAQSKARVRYVVITSTRWGARVRHVQSRMWWMRIVRHARHALQARSRTRHAMAVWIVMKESTPVLVSSVKRVRRRILSTLRSHHACLVLPETGQMRNIPVATRAMERSTPSRAHARSVRNQMWWMPSTGAASPALLARSLTKRGMAA
jgi:hypothetical protein